MSAFTYEPLRDGEIRLLALQSSYDDMSIKCELLHVSIASNPKYEALSYTWGDPGNERPIILGGQQVQVRDNLWSALYHLRDQERLNGTESLLRRILWIDALCINQNNTSERNQQVKLMTVIYRQAHTVIAWLGPPANGSDIAFDFIKNQAKNELQENAYQFRCYLEKTWKGDLDTAFGNVQDRAYWSRLWIVQEFILATELVIVCGHKQLTWEEFLQTFSWPKCYTNEIISNLMYLKVYGAATNLEDLMSRTKDRHCTDERDRIYGLLGLVNNSIGVEMAIDYSKPLWEVYGDAIRFHNSLEFAGREERPEWCSDYKFSRTLLLAWNGLDRDALRNLDWLREGRIHKRPNKHFMDPTDPSAIYSSHGRFGGQITYLGPYLRNDGEGDSEVETFIAQVQEHITNERDEMFYWMELLRALTSESRDLERVFLVNAWEKDRAEWRDGYVSINPQYNKYDKYVKYDKYSMNFRRDIKYRQKTNNIKTGSISRETETEPRYFMTDTGYVGLCPPYTQEGDILICLTSTPHELSEETSCLIRDTGKKYAVTGRALSAGQAWIDDETERYLEIGTRLETLYQLTV